MVYNLPLVICHPIELLKALKAYATACHQQVKEAFQDPSSKDLAGHHWELSDGVFWKHHQRKTALKPHWKGPYQVLLTTDTAAKLEGIEAWVHISQLRKALPDIWSCTYMGDL